MPLADVRVEAAAESRPSLCERRLIHIPLSLIINCLNRFHRHLRSGFQRLPRKTRGCYTFAASLGAFHCWCHRWLQNATLPLLAVPYRCRVLNSVTAGHQLARRAIAHQVVAVCATSLACLVLGVETALAVAAGGGAVTAGAALSAAWSLRRGVVPSGVALARMFVGVALKWCLVFILFSLGLLLWRLPALPLLVGVLVALAAQFVAMARR